MIFDYKKEEVFTKSLDVEDIGNFCIRATSEGGSNDYYAIVKTVMGKTEIFKFGPCMPDLNIPIEGFDANYKVFDFKEKTIQKEINAFINDPRKKIEDIKIITSMELFDNFPDVAGYMMEI